MPGRWLALRAGRGRNAPRLCPPGLRLCLGLLPHALLGPGPGRRRSGGSAGLCRMPVCWFRFSLMAVCRIRSLGDGPAGVRSGPGREVAGRSRTVSGRRSRMGAGRRLSSGGRVRISSAGLPRGCSRDGGGGASVPAGGVSPGGCSLRPCFFCCFRLWREMDLETAYYIHRRLRVGGILCPDNKRGGDGHVREEKGQLQQDVEAGRGTDRYRSSIRLKFISSAPVQLKSRISVPARSNPPHTSSLSAAVPVLGTSPYTKANR